MKKEKKKKTCGKKTPSDPITNHFFVSSSHNILPKAVSLYFIPREHREPCEVVLFPLPPLPFSSPECGFPFLPSIQPIHSIVHSQWNRGLGVVCFPFAYSSFSGDAANPHSGLAAWLGAARRTRYDFLRCVDSRGCFLGR